MTNKTLEEIGREAVLLELETELRKFSYSPYGRNPARELTMGEAASMLLDKINKPYLSGDFLSNAESFTEKQKEKSSDK